MQPQSASDPAIISTDSDMFRLYTFVKLFEQLDHAKSMLCGQLHMNVLQFFRQYRDRNGELRGDTYEGVQGILQPSRLSELRLGDISIAAKDLAAPVLLRPEHYMDWNLFCCYAVSNHGLTTKVSRDTLGDLKKALQVHEHCFGLGTHLVFMMDPNAFLARIRAALQRLGRAYRMGLVEYYDETSFHGFFREQDVPFRKRKRFQIQREYRVAVAANPDSPGCLTLDVGDLSDIARIATPSQFNADLTISLPDGATA